MKLIDDDIVLWDDIKRKYLDEWVVVGNPTFEGIPDKQVEAHAIDQSLDLYGSTVEVEFVKFIRGMRKFSGADELAENMSADEKQIRAVLGVKPKDL